MVWLHSAVVILALIGVAAGRYPRLRMNRATIAVVGATLLVISGAIPLEQAYRSVDLNTLALLFGMMVLNANLRLAGFFALAARILQERGQSPARLLVATIFLAGILSALFLNDTIALVFTPLVLEVSLSLRLNPVPYLMAVACSANLGSVATLIGNPQNMLIGVSSGIGFLRFSEFLGPVALGGLVLIGLVVGAVYRRDLGSRKLELKAAPRIVVHGPLLVKGLAALGLLLVLLMAGIAIPLAALAAASVLLITRRLKPERVFREIDWSLLVFFSGLFVIAAAAQRLPLVSNLLERLPAGDGRLGELTLLAAILSNLVSNVPAVLLLGPSMTSETAWVTLAMATTLAGNLTLLGSVANLIVAETAARRGVRLRFGEYLKCGVPITLLTLLWGLLWLSVSLPANH